LSQEGQQEEIAPYRHVFPYHLFQEGEEVLIYAAGDIGREFYRQAMRYGYVHVTGIVDQNAAHMEIPDIPVQAVEEIPNIPFDAVLIAVHDGEVAKEIESRLIGMGIPDEKIKWDGTHYYKDDFYRLYFSMLDEMREQKQKGRSKIARGGYHLSAKLSYLDYIERLYQKDKKEFVEFNPKPVRLEPQDAKVIAYYLPQFHRMEVNDKFHGSGFTEWTNTSRMIPLFEGHWQPHIPYDVGYYDLSNIDAMKRQIFLAKHYGVYGFCFYYYWFSGVKTMEKPMQMLLAHKELDMPFCICWATENWTSKWDGETHNVIFEQKLLPNDDESFMKGLLPYLLDSRYIKMDGRPVIIIYRVAFCTKDELKNFIQKIRRIAKHNGFPDLYVMISTSLYDGDVEEYGADALVEYQAYHIVERLHHFKRLKYVNPYYHGWIYDVTEAVRQKFYMKEHVSKEYYRSAVTSWDNSARNAGGIIVDGLSPATFKTWLKDIMRESKGIHSLDHNFVFANSWNEWAEGSHLEPDLRYGYGYLQALREAIEESRD